MAVIRGGGRMKKLVLGFVCIYILISFICVIGQAQELATWGTQADNLRGRNNQQFSFVCPGDGSVGRLWGTDVYTDDSSICTAAVHAGKITPPSGGVITIEIRPGAAAYTASTRNGVASQSYGGWHGSFVVVGATAGNFEEVEFEDGTSSRVERRQATWSMQADNLRGKNGHKIMFVCPGNGTVSSRLWGTDLYTDDSSVCTAAVHAGLINAGAGGRVIVEVRPGASSYSGSRRNGLTSSAYGAFQGSFAFLRVRRTTVGGGIAGATPITWAMQADAWRGQNGKKYIVLCPAGGTISSRLWGTDVYTDDSSICSAAVHSGLINTSVGGVLTVEIRAGAGSYAASSRYGVTSKAYGGWHGSFVFLR